VKRVLSLALLTLAAPLAAQTVVTSSDTPAAPVTTSPTATEIAAKLFPDGTYRRMLGDSLGKMMSGMVDQMGNLPLGDLAKAYGLDAQAAARLDKATVNKVMAIVDPAYRDRMKLVMDGMFKGMIPLFEQMEPELRAGLAESLAHRFTASELGELKAFFATPTGSSFASQQMLLFMDPAVMGRMQAQMPRIMQAMPALVGDAAKAAATLPKAKKYQDLTEAERNELAALLGVDPKKMKQ
jgi:hypothetical protein